MTFMMEGPRCIPFVLQVLSSVRSIERVCNRCNNIFEQLVYVLKGLDIRHASDQEINALLSE